MNIIGRLDSENMLVVMSNEEAATLLTMEAAAEQAAEKTAGEEWGGVMEAAGKASLFRISGTDWRGIKYTTHEANPVKAAEAFDRYRTFCNSVKLEFPVPRG